MNLPTFEMYGGDFGSYNIQRRDAGGVVVFVRRNQKGGGYTVHPLDYSWTYQLRNIPTGDHPADQIMELVQ